jgi:hypothetical protein
MACVTPLIPGSGSDRAFPNRARYRAQILMLTVLSPRRRIRARLQRREFSLVPPANPEDEDDDE